jgi:hypothetical protein
MGGALRLDGTPGLLLAVVRMVFKFQKVRGIERNMNLSSKVFPTFHVQQRKKGRLTRPSKRRGKGCRLGSSLCDLTPRRPFRILR